MGVLTKIQLLLKHLQFVGLLQAINIPFPKVYINFSSISNLISLDPSFLQSLDANFPVFTFRLQFLFIAVALPLMIMILTLLVFVNFTTIMWMCFSVSGILLVAVRVSQAANQQFVNGGNINSQFYLAVMVGIVAYCVLYRLASKLLKRDSLVVIIVKNTLSAAMVLGGGCMANVSNESFRIVVSCVLFNLACYVYKSTSARGLKAVLCLALAGIAVYVWMKVTISFEGVFPASLIIPAYLILALAALGWLQFLMYSNVDKGFGKAFVHARKKLQHLLDKSLLAVAFFFLSTAFIPVVTSCLQLFVCDDYNCPTGTKFNPYLPVDYSRPQNETVRNQYCDQCDFIGGCNFTSSALCPEFNESRLFFHPDTSCSDSVAIYYKIAGLAVLCVFVLVVSLMYYAIIGGITSSLYTFTQQTFARLTQQYDAMHQEYQIKKDRAQGREALRRQRSMMFHGSLAASRVGGAMDHDDNGTGGQPLLVMPESLPVMGASPPTKALVVGSLQQHDPDDPFDIPPPPPPPPAIPQQQQHWNAGLDAPLLLPPTTAPPRPTMMRQLQQQQQSSPRKRRGSSIFNLFGSGDDDGRPGENREELKEMLAACDTDERMDEEAEAPVRPTLDDAVLSVNAKVEPKASSLYNAYRQGLQFFLFAENIHRLSLVVVSVFVSPHYAVSSALNLGLHVAFLIALIVSRPYVGSLEQILATVSAFCDVLGAGYATLLWRFPDNEIASGQALGIGILVVGVIPVICGVVFQILDMKKSLVNPYAKQDKEEQEQRDKDQRQDIAIAEGRLESAKKRSEPTSVIEELQRQLDEAKKPRVTPEMELTDSLNSQTKRSILLFFVAAAIPLLMIALGLCIYATLHDTSPEFYNGSDLVQRTAENVLGGRESWDAFTSECCCFESLIPMGGYNITERWVCAALGAMSGSSLLTNGSTFSNASTPIPSSSSTVAPSGSPGVVHGVTVSRNRQSRVESNGIPIRGMCMRNFSLPNCYIAVVGDVVSLKCPADELVNTTLFAQRVLW